MDRYPEPADRDEAWAETNQERLGIRDEDWLTATTDGSNRRADPRDEQEDTVPPEDLETGLPADEE